MRNLDKQIFDVAEKELQSLQTDLEVNRQFSTHSGGVIFVSTKPILVKGNKNTIKILNDNGWVSHIAETKNGVMYRSFEKCFVIETNCIYCKKEITPEENATNKGYCSKEHNELHFKEVMDECYELHGCESDIELEV